MAKIVCPNCGHKNEASAVACSNCGNFIADTQSVRPSFKQEEPKEVEPTDTTRDMIDNAESEGTVIRILSRRGIYYWLSVITPFIILGAFLGAEHFISSLPSYTFVLFFVGVLVVPSLFRRMVTGVQFTSNGFSVKGKEKDETFSYDNIENAKIKLSGMNKAFLLLSFKNGDSPVTLDFDTPGSLRMLITQLRRRSITVLQPERVAKA